MDFVKTPIASFQTRISKALLDNMQDGIVEGITKAEEALKKTESGGVSPVITVTDIEGGHRVSITDVEGEKTFDVMDGKDGTGGAERLTGSTSEVTPQDVMSAIAAGKTILINHTDSTYGLLMFSNFVVSAKMNIVLSSVYLTTDFGVFSETLVGSLETGEWYFYFEVLARKEDVPEEKKTTAVDLSGFETEGKIVESYEDGSTNTYTFEFDSDGNPTKITDSSGNETVLTW